MSVRNPKSIAARRALTILGFTGAFAVAVAITGSPVAQAAEPAASPTSVVSLLPVPPVLPLPLPLPLPVPDGACGWD